MDELTAVIHSGKPESGRFYLPFVIIALLLYVGSYYLLVRKQEKPIVELWHLNTGPPGSNLSSADGSKPQYVGNSSLLHAVLTPIHWIDRRIRDEYWGPDGVVWEETDRSRFQLH